MTIWEIALVAGLGFAASAPQAQAERSPETLVRRFVDAYNARDAALMRRLSGPDIRWLSVTRDGVSTEAAGGAQLEDAMRKYFKDLPSARSVLRSLVVSGPFVSTVEEARWERGSVEQRQCSVGVYEIRNERIQNVWYFQAHAC